MNYGLSLPTHGEYGDVNRLVEFAVEAERNGWNGFFLWDHIARGVAPQVDPWIAITAVAVHTTRMRLGLLVTPLSRRRPWKVAREIVSLDQLSSGRMVLGAGLGDFQKKEFENFGEVADPRLRGERLDESLALITGLQSGEEFSYQGRHFKAGKTVFRPQPVQKPHVPVWVAGVWPNKKPFRRAARWQGVVPLFRGRNIQKPLSPAEVKNIRAYLEKYRTTAGGYDFCVSGVSSKNAQEGMRSAYEEAGVTWWLEFIYSGTGTSLQNMDRVRQGPSG